MAEPAKAAAETTEEEEDVVDLDEELHPDDVEDLFGADESFLTSTTREVVPIVQVDERTIGGGRRGPVTAALLAGFRRRAQELTRTLVSRP